jgi:hypothetical protein
VKYVLFDLETELLPGPLDLETNIPGITIGSTLTSDDDLELWHEQDQAGQARGGTLSQSTARALVAYLHDLAQRQYTIVTWNGAGFDFRVLAHASGLTKECVDLAWDHVDVMFWLHCVKGFSVQLAKAAQAVGSGKTQGMSGADAPRMWAQGQYEEVKQYVAQDVRATAAVYEAAVRSNRLRWINARGRTSEARGQLVSVRAAYRLPRPDTSWMSRSPWPRIKFVGWMLANR